MKRAKAVEKPMYSKQTMWCDTHRTWASVRGYTDLTTWYSWPIRKNGKAALRAVFECAWYSPLWPCQHCGVIGGPRQIRCRNDVYGWNWQSPKDYSTESLSRLCTSCWNKAKAIKALQEGADEIGRLSKQIQKAYRQANRSSHEQG